MPTPEKGQVRLAVGKKNFRSINRLRKKFSTVKSHPRLTYEEWPNVIKAKPGGNQLIE